MVGFVFFVVVRCGVLTVEIEHVDVETLEKLEKQGVDCQPKASTIRIIQDKYRQKVHFSQNGIPLPEFMEVSPLLRESFTNFSLNLEAFVQHFNPLSIATTDKRY